MIGVRHSSVYLLFDLTRTAHNPNGGSGQRDSIRLASTSPIYSEALLPRRFQRSLYLASEKADQTRPRSRPGYQRWRIKNGKSPPTITTKKNHADSGNNLFCKEPRHCRGVEVAKSPCWWKGRSGFGMGCRLFMSVPASKCWPMSRNHLFEPPWAAHRMVFRLQ